jgi:DNA repair protein RadA/Sms
VSSVYVCVSCERIEPRWYPQCAGCQKWSTFSKTSAASVVAATIAKPIVAHVDERERDSISVPFDSISEAAHDDGDDREPLAPIRITDVQDEDLERTLTGIAPLDDVLGGGLVTASVVLIGGDPGCGKSTLLAQAISKIGKRVLYVTGEETIEQATMRARRVNATHPEIWIVASNDIDEAIACARRLRPAILTIDSIQTMYCTEISGVAGSVSQVCECTRRLCRYARESGVTVIIVSHVTKDGSMSGPNTLKHLVDVVLLLDVVDYGGGPTSRRTLRADGKNRFGSTQEIGMFDMCADGMLAIVKETPSDPPLATATIGNAPPIEITAPQETSDVHG